MYWSSVWHEEEEGGRIFLLSCAMDFCLGPSCMLRERCNIGMFKKEYMPRLRAKFRRARKKRF